MSVYSTLTVTRAAAVEALVGTRVFPTGVYRADWVREKREAVLCPHCGGVQPGASNEQLGDLLDVVLESRRYNAIVVPDGTAPNDDGRI